MGGLIGFMVGMFLGAWAMVYAGELKLQGIMDDCAQYGVASVNDDGMIDCSIKRPVE